MRVATARKRYIIRICLFFNIIPLRGVYILAGVLSWMSLKHASMLKTLSKIKEFKENKCYVSIESSKRVK